MTNMTTAALTDLSEVIAGDLPAPGWSDWFLTQVGAALDSTVLIAMSAVVDAVMMPRPEDLEMLRASAAPFVSGPLWLEPRNFFAFTAESIRPLAVTSRHQRSLAGGVAAAHRFTTGYQPFDADATAETSADALCVEHWTHESQQPRGTVIALHGFSMGYPRIDAFALFARALFRAGYDVALVTLPFHGPRTPATARFSGQQFATPHVGRLNEAVRQAVFEIHILVDWLRQHTGAPVGLLGLSLGGYLAALMAGLRSDLAFVVPMVPPVCMGDLGWRFFRRSRHYRSAAPAFTRDELRAAFRVHSPLTYGCQVESSRLFIVAGRGDQIVPPEHPHHLWQHWDEPRIHWYGGSHLAPFRRSTLQAAILDHLNHCTA